MSAGIVPCINGHRVEPPPHHEALGQVAGSVASPKRWGGEGGVRVLCVGYWAS